MTTAVVLGVALATLVGVTLGLMGGGGSITLPILAYVVGLEPHEAIATSLLVVAATSVAALVPHARAGRVVWRIGIPFGAASMVGAFVAGRVAKFFPGALLLALFGGMMLVTAGAMMRPGKPGPEAEEAAREERLPAPRVAGIGLFVGAFTGLVGAGGGSFVVPALVLLAGLPMRRAVGTSLLVIALNSLAGFAGHAATAHIDVSLAAMMCATAIAGSIIGATFAARIRQDVLKLGFAWFVVVMAVLVLSQEVPKTLGLHVDLARYWPIELLLLALPVGVGARSLVRLSRRPHPPIASKVIA